jgi:plasmid stabilization system protein ParE
VKVVWLRTALRNLDDIAAWIARDSPAAAARVVQRIRLASARLEEHPESGRPGRVEGTRELIVPGLPTSCPTGYARDRVEILRVMHAARRWPGRLGRR